MLVAAGVAAGAVTAWSLFPAQATDPAAVDYVYFAANIDDFQRAAPGWVLPYPNLEHPRKRISRNPFLKDVWIRTWDYRNPVQPEKPSESAWPDVARFKVVHSDLDPEAVGELVRAIDGSDPQKIAGQIYGQELISSGEVEEHVMLIPRAITAAIAKLGESQLDTFAERGTSLLQQVPRRRKKRALREFHALAVFAQQQGTAMFLMVGP